MAILACPRCGSSYSKDVEFCGIDGERLAKGDTDPLIGRTIDRYRVVAPIGEGGMARVYRAVHIYLDQESAIKVLLGEVASDRNLARRFQREAQASSKIRHPNVVSIYDFGQTNEGLIFMAMELLQGRTLSEVIREERSFSPARAAYLIRQICEGLVAAHELGFVHRDLKPKNIMLIGEHKRELLKILDFGLVMIPDSGKNSDVTNLTAQGQIFGTPAYMAPEQVAGQEITLRADLYAVGVILYQLLSGSVPFGGPPAQAAMHHLRTEPPPLTEYEGLGPIAMRLLAKEPARRPGSAMEVIEMIDRLGIEQTMMPSQGPTPRPHVPPPVRASSREPSQSPPPVRASSREPAPSPPPVRASSREPAPSPPPVRASSREPAPSRRMTPSRAPSPTPRVTFAPPTQELPSSDIVRIDAPLLSLPPLRVELDDSRPELHLRTRSELGDEIEREALGESPSRSGWAFAGVVVIALSLVGGAALWMKMPAQTPSPAAIAPSPAADPPPVADKPKEENPAPSELVKISDTTSKENVPAPLVEPPSIVAAVAVKAAEKPRAERNDERSPPADQKTFEQRDLAIGWKLTRRGLNWRDMTLVAPEQAKIWALWRIGADHPTVSELERASAELDAAVEAVRIDKALLKSKLGRVRTVLAGFPQASRSSRYTTLERRLAALERGISDARGDDIFQSLASQITMLESDANIALGATDVDPSQAAPPPAVLDFGAPKVPPVLEDEKRVDSPDEAKKEPPKAASSSISMSWE